MTFRVLDALPVLVHRLGETINKVPSGNRSGLENMKVMVVQNISRKGSGARRLRGEHDARQAVG